MGTPLVSVIVPVFNEEKMIGVCLESLLAQDFPKDEVEILVVDNRSTDRSRQIIQFYPVNYLFEPVRSRARARNQALAVARGRFAAFIDGDCLAAPNWLRLLVESFTCDRTGGSGGEFIFPEHGSWLERLLCDDRGTPTWRHEQLISGTLWPSLWTTNALYDMDVLRRVGFFDESLVDFEDMDLGWRVSLAGYELKYVPEAHVAHGGHWGLWDMWRRAHEVTVGLRQLYYKYSRLLPSRPFQGFRHIGYLSVLASFYVAASLFWVLNPFQVRRAMRHFLHGFYQLAFLLGLIAAHAPGMQRPCEMGTQILDEKNFPFLKPVIWWRDQSSRVMIYRSQTRRFLTLNETASRMWRLLQEGSSVSDITARIASEFDVLPEEVKEDFLGWMDLMGKENLLDQTAFAQHE